jgi:uncharacterized protein (DUF1684 family)
MILKTKASGQYISNHLKKAFMYLILLEFAFALSSCNSNNTRINEEQYITGLLKERKIKDKELVDTTISRFNPEERARFTEKGLAYFPPDISYRAVTKIKVDTSYPVFQMPTTTDRKPNYRIYGFLEFTIKDTLCKLIAYQNMDYKDHPEYGGTLFIPFKDNTNEFTTYGGGRYIDIKIPDNEKFILDFNTAYNPYCAYSDRWSCPLVPSNNTLDLSVFAGEKAYK